MVFNCRFREGPLDGRLAEVSITEPFKVGMFITVEGCTYEILNGAAAQHHEQKQEGHPNLAVSASYVDDKNLSGV